MTDNNTKWLITGGAGFIGANFAFYLSEILDNPKIVVLDKLTYAGNINTIAPLIKNSNFKFVHGDITDSNTVDNLFKEEKFDIVINFAAESHVDKSIEDSSVFLYTNIIGTQVLMDACINYGNIRFHQISTDEVYGDLPIDKPELLFTEESPINTSSPYSASKAGADLLVLSYIRTHNLRGTISRASNNYGPYHFPEKLIPLTITRALYDQKIPVYGNGANIRDWLYVKDHCRAIYKIITKSEIGEIYNIGANSEKNNIEVVETILDILEKPRSLIEFVKDRPGHDKRYAIDPSKIKNKLGFQAEYDFNKGIIATINWFKENKSWWEKNTL